MTTREPMRVAIFGSSVTLLVSGERSDGTLHLNYPAALERSAGGARFAVTDRSRIYGLVSDCNRIWAYPLAQTRPDVVVLQFGLGETFPRVFPKALNAFLLGVGRHSGPARDRGWRLARRALVAIHRVERVVDRWLPLLWSRMSYRRFERELENVAGQITRQVGSRLILMTAYAASPPTPFLNPRMAARLHRHNHAIRVVAERVRAEVFDLAEVVDGRVLPDGLHMDVTTHALVAERLARHLLSRKHVQAA